MVGGGSPSCMLAIGGLYVCWPAVYVCWPSAGGIGASELRSYIAACENGSLYDVLAEDAGCSRDEAKGRLCAQVLFGRSDAKGKRADAFGHLCPAILQFLREWKIKAGDYKVVARVLQRLESVVMIDAVVPRLLADNFYVGVLTIHDSLLVKAKDAEKAKRTIEDVFAQVGVHPKVKVKTA